MRRIGKHIVTAVLIVWSIGCRTEGGGSEPNVRPSASALPADLGQLDAEDLLEASGLVVSRHDPGIVWTHNDSGNNTRLFALDARNAQIRARIRINSVKNHDWEDIAAGPGPQAGVNYLYIGDIGDNDLRREQIVVYRLPEPQLRSGETEFEVDDAVAFRFTYPDGPHNAETLLVDPDSGDLYVVTKGPNAHAYVSRAPQPGGIRALESVGPVPVDRTPFIKDGRQGPVAGDISADGTFVLIKTYLQVFRFDWSGSAESPFGPRSTLAYVPEPQGEAIAVTLDGRGYYTLSEQRGERIPRLYRYTLP